MPCCFQRKAFSTFIVFGCLLAASSAVFALTPQDRLAQYGRQTWLTENGLPQNTIHAIVQDHEGFIWLGTEGGLVRFDGLKFVVFNIENTRALKSNSVTSLLEDQTGTLWIGTTAGVTSLRQAGFQSYSVEDGLPDHHILSLSASQAGTVSVVTSEGAADFHLNHFVRKAVIRKSGEPVITIQDSHGRLWKGTEHGLVSSSNKVTKTFTTKDGLPSNRITSLHLDREGSLWIGTDSGAARLGNHGVETFLSGDPLSRDAILSIYEDREGNIWLGSDTNGLTVFRNQSFTTHVSREGAFENQVRCILQTKDGTFWIGTNGGGLRQYKDHQFSTLTTAHGLTSNIILSLAEDAAGTLLIGTPDGLNRLQNGKLSVLTSADGLGEDFVRSIYVDSNGTIWAGTRRGLTQIQGNRAATYTQANGLGSDFIGAIAQGSHHELWIGTLHGLTRWHDGVFTNYTTKDGLSSSIITELYMDGEGSLWIGTQGGGLNRLRDGLIKNFAAQSELPETIYGVNEDQSGHLWLAAPNGIFRVSKTELNRSTAKQVAVVSFGTNDGLQVSECPGGGHPTIWKGKDGSLWFSTAKGAAELRLERNRANQLPPPVVLESILVDDLPLHPLQVKEITPGHSRVSFEYTGLSFLSPHKIQFRYKLEGFDRSWINAGTRRIAYYTNLPPGHYRFRVAARSNEGVWDEGGVSFPIRIQPHYYQTWWFRFLLLVGATLFGYTLYHWKVKQVQAQFDAVLQERNRIAREIHDTLAQGFVGVSVQLEIVSRLLHSSVDTAQEHLDQARVQVRHSLADARQSIWELRSQSREHQDFAARVSQAVKQITTPSSARTHFQVHGAYRSLPANVEDELIRIAQEAVTNAVRHAAAQQIWVDLTFDTRKLRVVVNDDGCGFENQGDLSGPGGHFGLKGMHERAQQINAKLIIHSEIGKGTRVSVEVPA